MKKNKLLLLNVLALSLIIVGCGKTPSTSSENNNSSSSQSEVAYTSLTSTEGLFKTYASVKDYNFEAKYECTTIYHREFNSSWSTDYQYMEDKIQLTYAYNGAYFTDYYYEDAATDTYTYYIDMGSAKEYQTINGDNEYFFQYYSAIDTLDISDIDWTENFKVRTEDNVLVPVSDDIKAEMGQHIFGQRDNEYWETLEISYSNGYISKIEAVSIYMECNYYYTITFTNHDWVNIDLPTASQEYVGNQPYYAHEDYVGTELSAEQASIVEFLDDSAKANYTVNTLWELVQLDQLTGDSITTQTIYADKNAQYRYTDAATGLTYTDYLMTQENGQYIYYQDDGFGSYTPCLSNTDEYTSAIQNFALDQLNLANIDANDLIFNSEKGYFMPKDAETEKKLIAKIFGYSDYYFGLHIYFNETSITKVETSLYLESGTQIASYKKTYNVSNIGSSKINYPASISVNN